MDLDDSMDDDLPIIGDDHLIDVYSHVDLSELVRSHWRRRTAYHPPSSDDVRAAHEKARATIHTAGLHLLDLTPTSSEQQRMLDALDSALMWANAAIARHHPDNQEAK